MGKKTIFSKLMWVYGVIILLAMLVMGVLLFQFLNDYVLEEKKEVLNENASRVEKMFDAYLDNYSVLNKSYFYMNLELLAENLDAMTLISDTSGNLMVTVAPGRTTREGGRVNMEPFEAATAGETVMFVGHNEELFDAPMLMVANPLRYGGEIVGTVIFATTMPDINRARDGLFQVFLKALIFTLLLALIAISVLSRHISRPLKQMNEMAKVIKDGQFEKRVQVTSKDEIGELAETFNAMAVSLGNLENMRRGFVANVSHELRTPMTTISGFVEGMMDGTIPPEEHPKYLAIVLDEAKRLSRLVTDLLDLARMEEGQMRVELSDFDIHELIRVNLIKFEKRISEKKLEISLVTEEGACLVAADRDKIERVVFNLIDNAVKFSKEGGHIYVTVNPSGEKVTVSVRDDGMGISEEDLPYIWDRFYKSDRSRSADKTGTGLGLSMVKKIMLAHGQDITVRSALGSYTEFDFALNRAIGGKYEKA